MLYARWVDTRTPSEPELRRKSIANMVAMKKVGDVQLLPFAAAFFNCFICFAYGMQPRHPCHVQHPSIQLRMCAHPVASSGWTACLCTHAPYSLHCTRAYRTIYSVTCIIRRTSLSVSQWSGVCIHAFKHHPPTTHDFPSSHAHQRSRTLHQACA